MEASKSRTIAILAEKPSVARDIARVLGAGVQGKGYLQGNGYVVTWAIGHLVSLPQPHEIKPLCCAGSYVAKRAPACAFIGSSAFCAQHN
jgi:DNA topoisomerase IA